MYQLVFLRIVEDFKKYDEYFVQKKNALGQPGLWVIQKITCAICMLAYGATADANNEYFCIGETTTFKFLDHFCKAIYNIYGAT